MVPVPATADDWNGILCHQELLISLHCSDCSDSMQSDSSHSRLAHYQLLQETAKTHIFIWMWRLDFIVVTIHRLRYKLSQQYGHLCTYHIQTTPGKAKQSNAKQCKAEAHPLSPRIHKLENLEWYKSHQVEDRRTSRKVHLWEGDIISELWIWKWMDIAWLC